MRNNLNLGQSSAKKVETPNEVIAFSFEGKPFRLAVLNKATNWYVLSDVLSILQMTAHDLQASCIKSNISFVLPSGGAVCETLVNPFGLGSLVGSADLHQRFQTWWYKYFASDDVGKLREQASITLAESPLQANTPKNLPTQTEEEDSEIRTILFENKHEIRFFFDENGGAWFAFVDVCKLLGYTNPTKVADDHGVTEHLTKSYVLDGAGRKRETSFISEAGLKQSLVSSRKPQAERLRVWLFEQVLPAFRQNNNSQVVDFQEFIFENNLPIRIWIDENGNFWFAGLDVCYVLDYQNSRDALARHCKKDGVAKRYVIDNLGRSQELTVINESNLYRLVFNSQKAEAERFEKWVLEDVLPTLRKTGKYEMKSEKSWNEETNVALIQEILDTMQAQQMQVADTQKRMLALESQMAKMWNALKSMLPKVSIGKASFVYLFLNLDNLLSKLGKSNVPPIRMSELEANGSKLQLIKTIKLPSEELAFFWEGVFKTMFSQYHAGREIYNLNEFAHRIFIAMADEINSYYEYLENMQQGILPDEEGAAEIS